MDYFSLSVFWDKSCNNEVIKMQTKFNEMDTVEMDLRYSRKHGQMFVMQRIAHVVFKKDGWNRVRVGVP
jgi:ATP-dependent RNA circularization protein (DNA/RNA ligase family)